ncbi:MAG TPA: hypothetical protein DDZ90_22280, partial [Planctomycetaceae bacterium]|nr:hypothetical protein [Planctomycetaceae bacterium]
MSLSVRSVRPVLQAAIVLCSSLLIITHHTSAGQSNSLLDISADGKLLACSNRDSGSVTIVDLKSRKKLHEIKVGKHPEGVSFVGDSHQVAAAIYDEDRIVFLNADSGKQTGQTEVFDEPYGVVSTTDGKRIFVTLDYPGRIVEIDPATKKIIREFSSGKHLRGIAVSGDNQSLFVTEYYSALVRQVDIKTGETVDEWPGGSSDNLSRQITLHPRRAKAYLPHIRSRITVAHGAGSIFPIVSIVDTQPKEGKRRRKIP